MPCVVRGVRRVEIECSNLAQADEFYKNVWRLREVERTSGSIYYRGTSGYHSILAVHETGAPQVRRVVLDVATVEDVRSLHAVLEGAAERIQAPGTLAEPGGGYGFGFMDREGRNIALCTGVADHAALPDEPDSPRKIA